tara:strand:+ start:212 stop:898 length:687 start_codon:yes stop_codon:yes gene_type:complete
MISDERIMGFVEGEGCFSIGIQKYIDRRPRKTAGKRSNIKRPFLFRVLPLFQLTIREADRRILNEIKETLGFGSIYTQKRAKKSKTQQDVSIYYADGVTLGKKVREFFQKQRFYTRKGHDFQLWCQCLELMEKKKHLTKKGPLKICRIRDQMNFRRTKNKWSTDEIEKIWDAKPLHQTAHFDEKQASLIHNSEVDLKKWLLPSQGNSKKAISVSKVACNGAESPKERE